MVRWIEFWMQLTAMPHIQFFAAALLLLISGCVDGDAGRAADSTPIAIEKRLHFSDTHDLKLTLPRPSVLDSPKWDATDDNPPLAARVAIESATDAIKTLDSPVASVQWRFEHAALVRFTPSDLPNTERWWWSIAFYDDNAVELEPMAQLEVIVLLDGRVVTPDLVPAIDSRKIEY